jgi:DNA modification methylase
MNGLTIHTGDCREVLKTLPANSVHCAVTSPPYWGLRDYGCEGQIGLEQTPDAFVVEMVAVFAEVRRVLREDGTCWLNLGDSYNAHPGQRKTTDKVGPKQETNAGSNTIGSRHCEALKPKDLVGIPWRVAFALQADGWWLRQEIIWHKPAPMPESVTDRCTKAHEHIFLLAKSERYYFDADAIAESATYAGKEVSLGEKSLSRGQATGMNREASGNGNADSITVKDTRNKRSVWTVNTAPYKGAHFATFPPDLIRPCIKAGTSEEGVCSKCGAPYERVTERNQLKRDRPNDYTKRTGEDGTGNSCANSVAGVSIKTLGWQATCDCKAPLARPVVLDPFFGSGTTGQVARECGCECIGIDLNPEYVKLARKRNAQEVLL